MIIRVKLVCTDRLSQGNPDFTILNKEHAVRTVALNTMHRQTFNAPHTHTDTHTHTHACLTALFPGLPRVSQYQKGKTDLDFTEARDSEWQWHQLGHMQVCTSLQTDNHASTPPL